MITRRIFGLFALSTLLGAWFPHGVSSGIGANVLTDASGNPITDTSGNNLTSS